MKLQGGVGLERHGGKAWKEGAAGSGAGDRGISPRRSAAGVQVGADRGGGTLEPREVRLAVTATASIGWAVGWERRPWGPGEGAG